MTGQGIEQPVGDDQGKGKDPPSATPPVTPPGGPPVTPPGGPPVSPPGGPPVTPPGGPPAGTPRRDWGSEIALARVGQTPTDAKGRDLQARLAEVAEKVRDLGGQPVAVRKVSEDALDRTVEVDIEAIGTVRIILGRACPVDEDAAQIAAEIVNLQAQDRV